MADDWDFDENALRASVDLIGRAAAKEFQFGWLDDDVPIAEARWWAKARWGGRVVIEENHVGPIEAVDALARKVLDESMCVHCKRKISLGLPQPDVCVWHREDAEWVRGCLDEYPEPDVRPTTEKLAAALTHYGAPPEMIQRALMGYYDDFKSPLASPEFQLIEDAMAAGLPDIAEMAKEGKFDATKAESDAWAKSQEGMAVFAELMAGAGRSRPKQAKPKHQGRYTPPKGKGGR